MLDPVAASVAAGADAAPLAATGSRTPLLAAGVLLALGMVLGHVARSIPQVSEDG